MSPRALASEGIIARRASWFLPGWVRGLMAAGSLAGVVLGLGLGLVWTRAPITLDLDGQRYEILTHAKTVGDALRQAGLQLHPEDLVSPGLDGPLQPGVVVRIRRARPVVFLVDGRFEQRRTQATTVGEFIAKAGISLGPEDEIWLGDQLVEPAATLSMTLDLPPQLTGGRLLPEQIGKNRRDPPEVMVRRASALVLDDGGKVTTLHTTLATVGQVLHESGIDLFLGDQVTPGLQAPIASGMTVQIHRSVPVTIDVDGHLVRTRTRANTVAGALGQEQISLQGKDRVQPALNAPVLPDMTIRITRVREELAVEFEPIPFEMVWVADPEVEIDNIRQVQAGQLGLTKRRYRIIREDGLEVERFLEDAWSAQPPITKTMAYGTKIIIRTLDTPDGPIEYWRKMRVYTVSYTAASSGKPKSHPRYGYTALGWKATKGVVAVDPTVIPLRSRMYVPGYGFARAGDTGGGVKGKLVDLCFDVDRYESWHWWTDVYLLTPVPPRSQIRWVLPNWPKFPDRNRR